MASSKNWALKASTLVVVTACFMVIGASLVVAENFKSLLTLWGEDVQLTVYLEPEIANEDERAIENFLKNSGKTSSVELITQEKALNDFRVQLASYAPDIAKDTELLKLIPASLLVRLSGDIPTNQQMDTVKELAEKLKLQDGVDEVSYGQEWIEKYSALVSAIEMIFRFLGIVIICAALFVISNTIRASVQNRKDEIVIMEMIGATASMVRKPFLVEGASLGFFSSTIAAGMCYLIFLNIKGLVVEKLNFLQLAGHLNFMNMQTLLIFIFGGAVLGSIASYICVRQINDGYSGTRV